MKKQQVSMLLAIVSLLVLIVPAAAARPYNEHHSSIGAVYIMTNDPSGNSVLVYGRSADGILTWAGTFATNGLGGAGLTGSNQAGLVPSADSKSLLVVNPGGNDISAFRGNHGGLTPPAKVRPKGTVPIKITVPENKRDALDDG